MSRPLKISLTIVGLVLTLLVLAVVRVVTLDPNDYKDWIATRFEEQTGRTLTLEGEIGLDLYPWLDLRLERVTVGNAAGFGDTPLLQAENARVRIKTLPLLSQRYEIQAVELRGVSVNLQVDETGSGNWTIPASADEIATPSGSSAGLPLTDVIIGGVTVEDFRLRYEDFRNGGYYQVSDLQFTIGELIYGTPIDLNMTMEVATNQPELTADVALSGTLNYDLDNERYRLAPLDLSADLRGDTLPQQGALVELSTAMEVDLRQDSVVIDQLALSGLDASVQASVTGTSVSTGRAAYQGDISIAGDDLAQLFRAAGVDDLAGRLAALDDGSFQLAASATVATGSTGRVEIPSLQASMLDASLEGEVELTGFRSDNPTGRGRISTSGPDLPLVIEVIGQLTGGGESQLAVAGRELGQVAERRFNMDFEFNADDSGTVSIPTLNAQLLGNSVNGQFQAVNLTTDSPRLSGMIDAEGPDLPLLIQTALWMQSGPDSPAFQMAEQLRQQGNGEFVFDAQFDVDPSGGNITVPVLSVSALGLQLEGEIDAKGMSGNSGQVQGRLSVEGSELDSLLIALEQEQLAEVIERLSVNLRLSGTRDNLVIDPIQADLLVSGPQVSSSPVSLSVNAVTAIDLEEENLVLNSFSVNGLGLDATGRLNLEGPFDAPNFNGRLELASFNPRNFLEQLNQPVPATRDSAVLQRMALSSSIEGTMDSLSLEDFSLLLDDSRVTGSARLSNGDTMSAGFELAIDSIDVDRYLAPESRVSSTAPEPDSDTEIPVELLRNLDLQGDVRIGQLVVSGLQLSELQLTMKVSEGVAELAPFTTSLYQGTLDASASLSVSGDEPEAALGIELRSVNLEPLLFDLMDASYVSGRGNVLLDVNGSGADTGQIQQSLRGSGSVQLEDGVLRGVDVASVLRQLETMIRSRQPGGLTRGEQTAFESFSSSLVIDNGVISTNDLLLLSPGFQVTGRGTLVDLSDRSIAFNLATTVDQSSSTNTSQQYDIGGYTLPIACSGTLSAPRCLPDAGEILRARLQREVQDRVIDFLDRSLGGDQQEQDTPAVDDQQQPEQEPRNLRDEILNRALNRVFN